MNSNEEIHKLWLYSSILLLLLLIITVIVPRDTLFLQINQLGKPLGYTFWGIITDIGDAYVTAMILIFFIPKRKDFLVPIFRATIIATPIVQGLKYFTTVVRPGHIVSGANIIGGTPNSWSFPSGHSATVAIIFGVTFFMAKSKITRYLSFITIFIVALSRVMVSAHWPIDTIVGVEIGLSAAALAVLLTNQNTNRNIKELILTIILTLAAFNFIQGARISPSFPTLQMILGILASIIGIYAIIIQIKGLKNGKS